MAVIGHINHELLDMANYRDVNTLRFLYSKLVELEALAETGDSVAASIVVDLKTALFHEDILTERQKECILGHIVQKSTLRDLEIDLEIDKSTIHYHIRAGVKKLQTALESGEVYDS